jgi:tetrahydromethanopterin S-methyltransferase subunit G
MISQHQFNEVLKEINSAFEQVNKRIDELEEKVNTKEAPSGNTKKGKSKG